ncbi:Glutaminase [Streptomyces microflavus]
MSAADAVTDSLNRMRAEFGDAPGGRPADYIPQLGLADPDAFGLALVSMDGHSYSAGEADVPFHPVRLQTVHLRPRALRSRPGRGEPVGGRGGRAATRSTPSASNPAPAGRPTRWSRRRGHRHHRRLIPDTPGEPAFERILRCLGRFAGRELDCVPMMCSRSRLRFAGPWTAGPGRGPRPGGAGRYPAVAQSRRAWTEPKSATFRSRGSSVYWWIRQEASIRGLPAAT